MVSQDNVSDGVFKTRPVLSDVTNCPAKRPFASISADSIHKSEVDNSVKKRFVLQFGSSTPQNANENRLPLQKLSTQKSDSPPGSARGEEENSLAESSVVSGKGVQQGGITCSVSVGKTLTGILNNSAVQSDKNCGVDKLASSKGGAVELPTTSGLRDFGFHGLERCSVLKRSSSANPVVGSGDLLKHCTCSFCSKAAYIWTDLHCQDVKGRLGALKKSQKEASTMLQKFTVLKDKLVHDPQSNDESSKLELSLMEQWKSLFVHMENTFAQEGKQLESNFAALRDLRGSCKNDLDLTENSHSDHH